MVLLQVVYVFGFIATFSLVLTILLSLTKRPNWKTFWVTLLSSLLFPVVWIVFAITGFILILGIAEEVRDEDDRHRLKGFTVSI
jgi:amino acid transporter